MASHSDVEKWWEAYRCETLTLVSLHMNGRYPVRVQHPLEAAAEQLSAAVMANGYRTPMGPTGSYHCRKIGGSDTWSLHAYGVAIDWDYGENPYDRGGTLPRQGFGTDPRFLLTERQINAVEGIVNDDGDQIWRWLGWTIADFMHFQVNVPPDKCQPAKDTDMQYRTVDNVPDQNWARAVVDWAIDDAHIINIEDDFPDDWDRLNMTDGRLWTFLQRMWESAGH